LLEVLFQFLKIISVFYSRDFFYQNGSLVIIEKLLFIFVFSECFAQFMQGMPLQKMPKSWDVSY
jgi:hypothetical protein